MAPSKVQTAQIGVLAGVVLYSTNAVFGAWALLGGITFAFWRALLALPLLAVVAFVADRRGAFTVRPSCATIIAGLFLGVSTVYVALSEHDTDADLAGIVLAVGFAAFLTASKSARRTATPIGFLFWSGCFAALPTTVIAVASGQSLLPLQGRDVAALCLTVMCGGTTGHLLVTGSLRLLPATNAAVIRLTQPFFAMLFAWWIVDQSPTTPQVIGGLVTVGGVAGAAIHRARHAHSPVIPVEPGL